MRNFLMEPVLRKIIRRGFKPLRNNIAKQESVLEVKTRTRDAGDSKHQFLGNSD